jgi:hypothetical protein
MIDDAFDPSGANADSLIQTVICIRTTLLSPSPSPAKSTLDQAFDAIKEVGMPVYARGVTPIGPLHRGPGEINFPVCCGGIVVRPGDVICGGASGCRVTFWKGN